jgi:hypothetical protein
MKNTNDSSDKQRQAVSKQNLDWYNGRLESECVFTDKASTVLKFLATYSFADSDDDLPELEDVEMEQEWIEEKLPEVAKDFNSGFLVVHYQINNYLSVTIKKQSVMMN